MKTNFLYAIAMIGWLSTTALYAQEISPQDSHKEETTVEMQHAWTLKDCINHALEENIQLQQQQIAFKSSEVDVKTAKAALFPSLSLGTTQSIMNRPFQENNTTTNGSEAGTSDSKTTYNGNYSLNAQWMVWNGNKRINTIKQGEINEEMAGLALHQSANSIQEQVTQFYMQVLYAQESVVMNENTLAVSQAQLERGKELLEVGSLSKAEVAQLESQVGNDAYQVVVAKSSLQSYLLQLKQLLEIEGEAPFTIEDLSLTNQQVTAPLPNKSDIYLNALASRPEVESSKLSIQSANLAISIAKAGYYPSLSLNASTGTNHYTSSTNGLGSQLKYGWNNNIELSLSVPIFNNRTVKSSVEKARLQRDDRELALISTQKELYKTIENLWLDANNAQQHFTAAEVQLKSAEVSYKMINEQFQLGMKNIVELLTEKNNLLAAQQSYIQAKYMTVMNRLLLNFYGGSSFEESLKDLSTVTE
ncbi:MAG: TolC family protein [Phocaeicola sp.]